MNRQLRDQWLAALRSGKYKQGFSALRHPENSYCCLGVLCDVIAPDEWVKPTPTLAMWSFRANTSLLDHTLLEQLRLNEDNANMLMSMNDTDDEAHAYSFAQIANWIEENVAITDDP